MSKRLRLAHLRTEEMINFKLQNGGSHAKAGTGAQVVGGAAGAMHDLR